MHNENYYRKQRMYDSYIDMLLRDLYPMDQDLRWKWLITENEHFDKRKPIDIMYETETLDGFKRVVRHLTTRLVDDE